MTQSLRVVFAGTPEFAATALAAVHAAGFHVPLVLTQPDRPAGRGMKLAASPVKRFAVEHGLEVAQPASLRIAAKAANGLRGSGVPGAPVQPALAAELYARALQRLPSPARWHS